MKIYFCDECHESIPLKDIADNTITIEGGKIYHEKCRPKAAKPGGRVSYATASVSLLLGLGIGAVVMAIWGDAILGKGEAESVTRQLQRLETAVSDLKTDSHRRLEVIERDLEESPGLDGRSGKLARAFQGIHDNGDAVRKMRHSFDGLGDELRSEQETQGKELAALKAANKNFMEESSTFTHQKLVPDLERAMSKVLEVEENIGLLNDRVDSIEENGVSAGNSSTSTPGSGEVNPALDVALDPAKAKRRQGLLDQLKSKDGPKRFAAAVDLGEFKDRGVEIAMVDLLKDPADYVRSTALTNLMDMDARWAIPEIIPVLKSEDYVLRETAIAALEKLMARSISLDPDASSAKVLAKIRELNKWWDKNKDKVLSKG